MSLLLEVERLENAKANIKTAIAEKEVIIPDETLLDDYAPYIDLIETESGIECTLSITTSPGATVTATLGDKTVSAIADETGVAVLLLDTEGVWTVTAELNGDTRSTQIDTSLSAEENAQFVDSILANNDWATISEISRAGTAPDFWNVGDEKEAIIGGSTFIVRIVGFDHYAVKDATNYGRAKAGIALEVVELTSSGTTHANALTQANTKASSNADFSDYAIEFNYPDTDRTNGQNYYEVGLGNIVTKSAKGILPSEKELFGTVSKGALTQGEGTQFAFYKAGNSKVKYRQGTTTATAYWLRTLGTSSAYLKALYINTSGAAAVDSGSSTTNTRPHSFIFCI